MTELYFGSKTNTKHISLTVSFIKGWGCELLHCLHLQSPERSVAVQITTLSPMLMNDDYSCLQLYNPHAPVHKAFFAFLE